MIMKLDTKIVLQIFFSFSVVDSPLNLTNFQIYFWMGEHFEGSELLVYNERTFFLCPQNIDKHHLADGHIRRLNNISR